MPHTLLFLQPGHFHAALLFKSANERIDLQPRIHTRHRLLTEALIRANQETDTP